MLNARQIRFLLDRLKWEPVYDDIGLVLCRKRSGGYADDKEVSRIEAALSIMLEAVTGEEVQGEM